MEKRLIHGSLFSGIGGFDLAAEWAGMVNAFNCEIDPFCRRVLKYHFPNAEQYEDIQKADFSKWTDRIDVLTGGFPCQPFSLAGKRKGTEDDRYLWPAMLDIIRIVRPRWIVAENVLGIVNWSKGLVFDTVCSDLETNGYEIQPFIIPACGVGAPHRRDRIWFIAHRTDTRLEALRERSNEVHANRLASDSPCLGRITRRSKSNRTIQEEKIGSNIYVPIERSGSKRTFTNPNSERCCQFVDFTFANRQGQSCRNSYAGDASDTKGKRFPERNGQPSRDGSYSTAQRHNCIPDWKNFPAQSPVCGRNDGLSDLLDPAAVFAKSVIDRHRNPVPRWRIEAIKCYGNAIVPQVAYRVLHTIRNYINAQLQ